MDQTKQIKLLYIVIDDMMQKIIDLRENVANMEKIIKSLQEENVTLNNNAKFCEKKYESIENFVEICTDQMPRLLTRLVVNTQSDDLATSLDESIKKINSNFNLKSNLLTSEVAQKK